MYENGRALTYSTFSSARSISSDKYGSDPARVAPPGFKSPGKGVKVPSICVSSNFMACISSFSFVFSRTSASVASLAIACECQKRPINRPSIGAKETY
jgi:hypothetical protein